MAAEKSRIEEHREAARHATSIVNQLSSVVQSVQREDLENGGGVTYPPGNPNYRIVTLTGAVHLRRRHVLKQWLLSDMHSYEARQHFLSLTSHWLGVSADNLERLAKERTAVRKELEYFQTVLKELEPVATTQDSSSAEDNVINGEASAGAVAASPSPSERECIICSGTDMSIVSMAPCGHYFCTTCLHKWLVDHSDCPTCRQSISRNDVMWIHLSLTRSAAMSSLTRKFGTKPAALVQFIQTELAADADSRFIVFSMWHAMLKLTQNTLEANGIQVTICDSKTDAENAEAIELFRTSPTVRVIMLSMEHAAAGTNLQAANHVVLLEPPGINPAHGVAQETQAIGRAARLGQERVINITRFVINDTIESELHKQNHDQRMASESGRRFACDTTDDDANATLSAATSATSAGTLSVVCAITPPDPGCFEVGGASALPAQHTEPIVFTVDQPADGTATVENMRASILELARQRMPSLNPRCTLALYFAGRQLMDRAADSIPTKITDHNIQSGTQLHGVLRPDAFAQDTQAAHYAPPAKIRAETAASVGSAAKAQGPPARLSVQSPATHATVDERSNAQFNSDSKAQAVCTEDSLAPREDQRDTEAKAEQVEEAAVEEDDAQQEEDEEGEEDQEEELTTDEIDSMRVVELRAELLSRGLLASGRRAALLSRLKGYVSTRASSARKRRRDTEENESSASSPIFTPHGTPVSDGDVADSTSVASDSRKRKRSTRDDDAGAAETSEAAVAETGSASAPTSSAASAGSRHCDREAALRNVIAMGFTPQRAARLQQQAASPGSDGIGDTERLIAVLLGESESSAAATSEHARFATERRTASANRPATDAVTLDLTQEEDPMPSQSQTQSQSAAAFQSSSTLDQVVRTAEAEGVDNFAFAQLAEMGFNGSVAARALKAAGGDVQEALSRLLYRASVL